MSALVIIRTPFQAWLVQKVLEEENIEVFDVLYFTQNNAEEDKYYYSKISEKSRNSEYIFVPPQRFSILSSIMLKIKSRTWYKVLNYDLLLFASIDALFISSLANTYPDAKVITFDDGTANININSIYHVENNSRRVAIYRYFMNALPLEDLKRRISRHYTLYKGKVNIVELDRLIYLEGWTEKVTRDSNKDKIYFIGAPFEDVMSPEQITRIENYVKKLGVDAYVAHPRERKPLDIGVDFLNKNGLIAEDAIIADADGRTIRLVGWFSTVMINLESVCENRIVLLPKDSPQTPELFELSKKAGCTPILI